MARLADFVEQTHALAFVSAVGVDVSGDIGADLAGGFEPIAEVEWNVMRLLGIVDPDADRAQANQLRIDRIRGVCCSQRQGGSVTVEVQSTKLATEVIIVHELTHALHLQTIAGFSGQGAAVEAPSPEPAATEGVPQYIAFEYLRSQPEADQELASADLPIIPDDLVAVAGSGPARFLNFAYGVGPTFVEQVVQARGVSALVELIEDPPITGEQVLFPDKYLAGEAPIDVDPPTRDSAGTVLASGRVGAAMLLFVLEVAEHPNARELVEGWAGDSYVMYRSGDRICLAAAVVTDGVAGALALGEALEVSVAVESVEIVVADSDPSFMLRSCV